MTTETSFGESRVNIEGRGIGQVRVRGIGGTSKTFPTLYLRLGFQLDEWEKDHLNDSILQDYRLLHIRGELAASQHNDIVARFDARNDESQNPYSKYRGVEDQTVELAAPIDPWTLERLERWREGNDPKLFLRLWADAEGRETRRAFRCSIGTVNLNIPHRDWLKVLKDVGYGEYTVLELPVIQVSDDRFKSSNEFLAEALKQFNNGEYRNAVKECREAVDKVVAKLIKGIPKDDGPKEGERERKLIAALQGLDTIENDRARLFAKMMMNLYQMGNPAVHRKEEHRREEAKFILHTSAHLMALVGDLASDREG